MLLFCIRKIDGKDFDMVSKRIFEEVEFILEIPCFSRSLSDLG